MFMRQRVRYLEYCGFVCYEAMLSTLFVSITFGPRVRFGGQCGVRRAHFDNEGIAFNELGSYGRTRVVPEEVG